VLLLFIIFGVGLIVVFPGLMAFYLVLTRAEQEKAEAALLTKETYIRGLYPGSLAKIEERHEGGEYGPPADLDIPVLLYGLRLAVRENDRLRSQVAEGSNHD